ncbi:MAG: FecR domain-containing protein, partial [Anaerolineae bacterium]
MAACLLFVLLLPWAAFAQQAVGVITGVQGRVELSRRPAPTPVALQVRDDLFLRDIIDTYEESIARVLFGGQSTVTVRELTRFEVRAELLPTGATRTTYDLKEGKIRVDAARELMQPGDLIEVRTPNALATVRGTILIAEYISRLGRSFFMCLGGTCRIAIRGLTPFTLVPNKSVTVTGTEETGIQPEPVQSVTPDEAARAQEGLEMTRSHTAEAGRGDIAEAQMKTAVQLVETINGTVAPAVVTVPLEPEDAAGKIIESTQDQQSTDAVDPEDVIPPEPVPPPALEPPDTPDVLISGTTVTPEDAFGFSITGDTIVLDPGETLKTFSGPSTRSGTSPVVQISGATVTQPGSGLIEVEPGANATLAGQLLEATNSNLSTGGSLLLVEGALKGTGTAPFIQIDPTTITTGGVGLLTTFDEDPPGSVPVDGLTFEGVTYGFTVGGVSSTDATFGGLGPGQTLFVQDPSLEGNASGVLTLDFTSPVSHLGFGLDRNISSPLTPGSNVTLTAADGSVIGTFDLNTATFEGLFVYDGSPASRAVVTFPSAATAPRFALDNLAIIGGGLISLEGPGAGLSVAGPLLQAQNLSLTSSAPLLSLTGGPSLTTGGPSLELVNSDLNLGVLAYFAG